MIHHLAYPKLIPIAATALLAVVALIAVDTSPLVPWILGALVPIGISILGVLWRIQNRMSIVETQVSPLWSALQKEVSDALHHPHPGDEEADKLLEDLEALRLTPEKTSRLKELLRKRADNPKQPQGERTRSELLLFIMPRVVKQKQEMDDNFDNSEKINDTKPT